MDNEENEHEDDDGLRPVFNYPRLDATFARAACLNFADKNVGKTEILMDEVFKLIDNKISMLMEEEEVDDEDMNIAIAFDGVEPRVKEIVIDRLMRLNYEVANSVDTEEEADYVRDLEEQATNDPMMQKILDEFFLASDKYYISW